MCLEGGAQGKFPGAGDPWVSTGRPGREKATEELPQKADAGVRQHKVSRNWGWVQLWNLPSGTRGETTGIWEKPTPWWVEGWLGGAQGMTELSDTGGCPGRARSRVESYGQIQQRKTAPSGIHMNVGWEANDF